MVELLRQPSWSSACGFVDGGRTPRGRAFLPPAAHNSTGSTTTIKLPINELHPLELRKTHYYWQNELMRNSASANHQVISRRIDRWLTRFDRHAVRRGGSPTVSVVDADTDTANGDQCGG